MTVGTVGSADHVRSLKRCRAALVAAFLITGIGMSTWITRTPAIRDTMELSNAEMGLLLAAVAVGSVAGIASGNPLLAFRGARFVIGCGMLSMSTGVALTGVGTALQSGPVAAMGLALFGCGMAFGEIGQNVEAVGLETAMRRSMLPGLQGCYSIGVFAGGLTGVLANSLEIPVVTHLSAAALVVLGASAWLITRLPAATGTARTPHRGPEGGGSTGGGSPWIDRRLLVLGLIALVMALSEGAANDWLPLIVVDGFGHTPATGSLIYAFFGLAVAIGRFFGGPAIDQFGRIHVMRVSVLTAASGIALVAFAADLLLGGIGVLLWGLGTSLGFPIALSAAGDHPTHAARRVGLVVAVGYAGFLIGPPLLGFLAEHAGLRTAILVVLVAVVTALFFSRSVQKAD